MSWLKNFLTSPGGVASLLAIATAVAGFLGNDALASYFGSEDTANQLTLFFTALFGTAAGALSNKGSDDSA